MAENKSTRAERDTDRDVDREPLLTPAGVSGHEPAAHLDEPEHLRDGESSDAAARDRGELVIGDLPPLAAASQDHALPGGNRPATFYAQAGSYITSPLDIFASGVGIRIASYTFDATTVSADANGNKVVPEGTVLSATAGGKAQPRTSTQTAIGVLDRRINVRDGDREIGLVVGGDLISAYLTDAGTFGTVTSGAQTDLAALGIHLRPFEV